MVKRMPPNSTIIVCLNHARPLADKAGKTSLPIQKRGREGRWAEARALRQNGPAETDRAIRRPASPRRPRASSHAAAPAEPLQRPPPFAPRRRRPALPSAPAAVGPPFSRAAARLRRAHPRGRTRLFPAAKIPTRIESSATRRRPHAPRGPSLRGESDKIGRAHV